MIHAKCTIIGLGLRGLIIASKFKPSEYKLGYIHLVEKSTVVGAGVLERYTGITNSIGSKFFSDISISEEMLRNEISDQTRKIMRQSTSVSIKDLSCALEEVAISFLKTIPRNQKWLNCGAKSVNSLQGGGFIITLGNGKTLKSDSVILCTGRVERPLIPELRRARVATFKSSEVLMNPSVLNNFSKVTIVGSSHSAFQILTNIHKLNERCNVQIVYRTYPKLYFLDKCEADDYEQKIGRKLYDRLFGVCEGTGQINRDSGIRDPARSHLVDIINGTDIKTELVHSRDFPWSELDKPDDHQAIVQATGFEPAGPIVEVGGISYNLKDTSQQEDGQIMIHGQGIVPNLFGIRIHPTPLLEKDRHTARQRNYATIVEGLRNNVLSRNNY